jgi:iron complex transport system substrate-binding protein
MTCRALVALCSFAVALLAVDAGGVADTGPPAGQARRLVTLAPSLTELVFAAGAGKTLVGVSAYSDFPADAKGLPQVADAAGIAWESLLSLKPDVVLAWRSGTRQADIARLQALGLRVETIDIAALGDVAVALRSIGRVSGSEALAEPAARKFEEQLAALKAANTGKPVVKTFFEISAKPLMTVNGRHVISEMITLCGGLNVFADAPSLVPEPSREELAARNPLAILYGASVNATKPDRNAQYAGVANYRPDRVHAITADYVYRPGPRLLRAAGEICAALDKVRAGTAIR